MPKVLQVPQNTEHSKPLSQKVWELPYSLCFLSPSPSLLHIRAMDRSLGLGRKKQTKSYLGLDMLVLSLPPVLWEMCLPTWSTTRPILWSPFVLGIHVDYAPPSTPLRPIVYVPFPRGPIFAPISFVPCTFLAMALLLRHKLLMQFRKVIPFQPCYPLILGMAHDYSRAQRTQFLYLFVTYSTFLMDGYQVTNLMSMSRKTRSTGPDPPRPAIVGGLNTHGIFEGDASLTRGK